MNTEDTKLQSAETDLKQLMADVTRAMEKAQQAIARVTAKEATANPETEATPPSS
jgi:predicted ribonuclease toxin of YeeF-YezG toxin-antitoxin module